MKSLAKYKNFLNEKNKDGYYTFEDLEFKPFTIVPKNWHTRQATMTFDNGYKISVVISDFGYNSNGKDTYEVLTFKPGSMLVSQSAARIDYPDHHPHLSKDEITESMIRLQSIKPSKQIFTAEDPFGEEDWENEGIKWYSNGKFTDPEDIEIHINDDIKIGDKVPNQVLLYWSNDTGDRIPLNDNIHMWKSHGIKSDVIEKVNYCENLGGYTGPIVKMRTYWCWFQAANLIKMNEGIKWYSKGKFSQPEESEEIKKGEKIFEIGDLLRSDEAIYWRDKSGVGDINAPGEWLTHKLQKYNVEVKEISYCEDMDGYTGQIVKLSGDYWPWFQSESFEKITNEGIKWYSKGKFTQEEIKDSVDTFNIGDQVNLIDKIEYYPSFRFHPNDNKIDDRIIHWDESAENDGIFTIRDTGYAENIDGYTGQVVKLQHKWPWYKTKNMKLVK